MEWGHNFLFANSTNTDLGALQSENLGSALAPREITIGAGNKALRMTLEMRVGVFAPSHLAIILTKLYTYVLLIFVS